MAWFIISLIAIIIIGGVITFFMYKYNRKLKEENDKLTKAVKNQKDIINAFTNVEREAQEQKNKLGKGDTDDRVNASINVLQNIG